MIIKRLKPIRHLLALELVKMREKINKLFKVGSGLWKKGYDSALAWIKKEKQKKGL